MSDRDLDLDLDLECIECTLEDVLDFCEDDLPTELWRDALYALRLIRAHRQKLRAHFV